MGAGQMTLLSACSCDRLTVAPPLAAVTPLAADSSSASASEAPAEKKRSSWSLPVGSWNTPEYTSEPVLPPPGRPVCEKGCKCHDRTEEHLRYFAHPFDGDYTGAEERTLFALYNWIDANGSGLVSKTEMKDQMPLICTLSGEHLQLSEHAWDALDEDGNGYVNFSEFAYWAGPRLGFPLGVGHLFQYCNKGRHHGSKMWSSENTNLSMDAKSEQCSIMGCPCECFKPRAGFKSFHRRAAKFEGMVNKIAAKVGHKGRLTLRLAPCICGHKHSSHSSRPPLDLEVPYPRYWKCPSLSKGSEFQQLVSVGEGSLARFQKLFDETYRDIWTRDRRKHNENPNVPKGFRVVSAKRNENSRHWREYEVRRAELLLDCKERGDDGYVEYRDIKSAVAWQAHGDKLAERLIPQCNEWYLFHGTDGKSAEQICEGDFRIANAGIATGTLYGRGAYLAESISKADEYAKPNAEGHYAVLIVRGLGGNVLYTAELEPDPEELVEACIEGPYDCVLGDREACRNTYREFVFFDSQNIFAEYLVFYERLC